MIVVVPQEEGRWISSSKLAANSVESQIKELVAILKEVKEKDTQTPEHVFKAVVDKVFLGVVNVLTNSPCYTKLQQLKHLIINFGELGVQLKHGPGLLFISLAELGHESDEQPDFNLVDSVDRNEFRDSLCYKSFCQFRFERELGKAKAATGAVRLALLKEITTNSSDGVAPDVHTQAGLALQAFDDTLPLCARVDWASKDESAAALVREWEPAGKVCRLVEVAGATPAFGVMNAADFSARCRELLEEGVVPMSPLVQDACTFFEALDEVEENDAEEPTLSSPIGTGVGSDARGRTQHTSSPIGIGVGYDARGRTQHTIIPVGSGVGSDSGGGTLQRTVGESDAEEPTLSRTRHTSSPIGTGVGTDSIKKCTMRQWRWSTTTLPATFSRQ